MNKEILTDKEWNEFKKKYIDFDYEKFKVEIMIWDREEQAKELRKGVEALLSKKMGERENKIKAAIAVDVMECELVKEKSEHTKGHIHGLKRALHLIDHLN